MNVPIDRLVVALGGNDLWGKIVGRTTESPRDIDDLLGEAKVGDLEVAMAVEKQIFGLQVSIDNVHVMQVLKREDNLGSIKLGYRIGKALGLAQQTEELATLDKVHDHVKVLCVLESTPEGDEKGVLDTRQHAALVVSVLDLLHFDNLLLFEHLHGIVARIVARLHQVDTTKAAGAKGAA